MSGWTSLGRGCRMHLWMLALRSNLEEPGHAALFGANDRKREEHRFWKGEGNSRTGGTHCGGRAGGHEGLVCSGHPLLNAWGGDVRARFMKVKLSSQTERQNWAFQGTAGKLGYLSKGRGIHLSEIWQVTLFIYLFHLEKGTFVLLEILCRNPVNSNNFIIKNSSTSDQLTLSWKSHKLNFG